MKDNIPDSFEYLGLPSKDDVVTLVRKKIFYEHIAIPRNQFDLMNKLLSNEDESISSGGWYQLHEFGKNMKECAYAADHYDDTYTKYLAIQGDLSVLSEDVVDIHYPSPECQNWVSSEDICFCHEPIVLHESVPL